ncbi:MAG TPA: hypothetical protein VGN17_27590 [Bryobacteraceae bacterium]|jgi:hypothetical protein
MSIRGLILAAGFLAASVLTTSCAGTIGVGYRTYDPYRSDYHVWDANEGVYYNQWTVETHRDPHRDFRKLKRNDQTEYWKWRHDRPDHR